MIAAWLMYATAVGALVGCAGHGLEILRRWHRRPVRDIWIGALLCSLALPHLPQVWLPVGLAPAEVELKGPVFHLGWVWHLVEGHRGWDSLILILWGTGAAAALAMHLAAWLRIQVTSRHWRRGVLQGSPVLFAPDLGPAVFGLARPSVVVPEWVSQLDERSQQLILEHEREHARRHDPLVMLVATLAVLVFPWNPALWWQLRRLRLAMELDCDSSVLERHADDLERYGALLLTIVGRSGVRWKPVAGISGGRSQLEMRLRAMTERSPRRGLRALAIAGASTALLLGATVLPNPVNQGCPENPVTAMHP